MAQEFAVTIEWVPFELHPETPPEGLVRDPNRPIMKPAVRDYLVLLAEDGGIAMHSAPVMPNGRHALEATEWARDQGAAAFDTLHRALFRAYFEEGRNISTVDQVVAVAEAVGLDGAALRRALESGAYRARVQEATNAMRALGITSTPTYLFEDRYMVVGAQDDALFADVLRRLGVPRRADAAPRPAAE